MKNVHQSNDFFKSPPRQPTYSQVIALVKKAENELEQKLHERRDRLRIQFEIEQQGYYNEINEKHRQQRVSEMNEQCKNLERLRMEREEDHRKYIESKQIQQQIQNSNEIRSKLSQKLIDECAKSRCQQLEDKLRQKSLAWATENAFIDEQRLRQQKQLQKELDAEQISQQKHYEMRQELDKQVAIKRDRELMRKQQDEIERKLQQEISDEIAKKSNDIAKQAKQYAIKQQKDFLLHQIEQRQQLDKWQRQQEIQLAKLEIERIKQDEKLHAQAIEQAKRVKNIEIQQFNNYMHRMRADQEESQTDRIDWTQVKRANNQMEIDAQMERQKKKHLLNVEQRSEYIRKMNEKYADRQHEREMEFSDLQQTQKQNAMYEQMMAEKRQHQRLQFVHDLDHQIELKILEKARTMESELHHNRKIDEITCATDELNQQLLRNDDDIEKLMPVHPFHHRFKSRFS